MPLAKKYPNSIISKYLLNLLSCLKIWEPKQYNANFIKKYGLEKTHLDVALRSKHEIYLNGMYVAIPMDLDAPNTELYKKVLKDHFGF